MVSNEVLRKWNIGMAIVQAAVGGSLFYIYKDNDLLDTPVQLTKTGVAKDPTSSGEFGLDWVQKDGTEVYIAREVIAFFFVTAFFHALYAIMGKSYDKLISNRNNYLRWIEYSISATLMMRIIALQSGVRDQYTLTLISTGTVGVMLQGQIVEAALANSNKKLTNEEKSVVMTSTIVGWILMVANFYVIVKQFMGLSDDIDGFGCPDVKIPDFVVYIIITQLLFYSTFGLIQIYQIYKRMNGSKVDYSNIERMYLIDSLLSKVTLGALLGYSVTGADQGAYSPFKC